MFIWEYEPTLEEREAERERAEQMPVTPRSIERGRRNPQAMMGESVVARLTGYELSNTFEYDLLRPDGMRTADVKTKVFAGYYYPEPDYVATVSEYNATQACDIYAFTRCRDDMKSVLVVGWLPRNEFYDGNEFHDGAEFFPVGYYDQSNHHVIKEACFNIPIYNLKEFPDWMVEDATSRGFTRVKI